MLKRLINISRPRFWMYTFGSYLIGVGAYSTIADSVIRQPYLFLWLIYFTLPVNLFVYGINDIADGDTDAFNTKKGEYEARLRNEEKSQTLIAVIVTHLIFSPLFLISSVKELLCIGIFIITNILYSLPPFRLKAVPFIDSIVNGVFCSAIGLMGYFSAGGEVINWYAVVAAGLWSAIMHAYSAVPDIEADKKAGISTIATRLGDKGTLWLCGIGYFVAGLVLIFGGLFYYSLFVIPYFILIGLSFYFLKRYGNIFGIYKIYPLVTLIVGGLIYWL